MAELLYNERAGMVSARALIVFPSVAGYLQEFHFLSLQIVTPGDLFDAK